MAKLLKDLSSELDNAAEVEKIIKQNLRDEGCKLFIDDGEENIYIPKARLDAKIAELRSANETINSLNDQIDGLQSKQSNGDAELIKNLKKELKDYQGRLQQVQIDNAVANAAKGVNAKDVNDVLKFIDMSKVSLDTNGNVLGLQEQVDALVESKPYLFDTVQQAPSFGGTGAPGKPSNEYLFGSKTMHEGDFGKLLAQNGKPQQQNSQVDSDYFFKNNNQ